LVQPGSPVLFSTVSIRELITQQPLETSHMFAGKHAGLVIEEAELSSVYELISAQPHGSKRYRRPAAPQNAAKNRIEKEPPEKALKVFL
jgi:hypothetical protein